MRNPCLNLFPWLALALLVESCSKPLQPKTSKGLPLGGAVEPVVVKTEIAKPEAFTDPATHGTEASLSQRPTVIATSNCREAESCRENGLCTRVGDRCVAISVNDCEQSNACKDAGWCGLVEGGCEPTAERHCRSSSQCSWGGICSFDSEGHLCRNTRDADCRASKGCKNEGRCYSDGVWCVSTPPTQ